PATDRLAVDLEHGQIDQHREAEGAEEKPEPTKEMERPVPVAPDERHRQEVEEATQVALDAVAGAAVLAWAVVHGQLGDAMAAVVGEHRDEAVQLAVEAQILEDLGPVSLQAAVEVVQPQARDAARHPVED